MTEPPTEWVRTERLDAARLVEELYDVTGVRLQVEGPAPGGEVGAAFVQWEQHGADRRSVLKWRPHSRIEPLQAGPLAACEMARGAGIPAPATELVAQVGHVRDSKNPNGAVLAFSGREITAWLDGAAKGEFDHLAG